MPTGTDKVTPAVEKESKIALDGSVNKAEMLDQKQLEKKIQIFAQSWQHQSCHVLKQNLFQSLGGLGFKYLLFFDLTCLEIVLQTC